MKQLYKSAMDKIHATDALVQTTKNVLTRDITSNEANKLPSRFHKNQWVKQFAFSAVVLLLVLGLSVGGYAFYMTPVAYLSMDINPSVEASVNAINRVLAVKGLNEDGTKLVDGLEFRGMSVSKAVDKLVKTAGEKGYLPDTEANSIALTTASDDEERTEKLDKSVRKAAEKALEENELQADVVTENIALERIEEAKRLSETLGIAVTPGKLNLVEKMETQFLMENPAMTPAVRTAWYKTWLNKPVRDIMKETKSLRKQTGTDIAAEPGKTPPGQAKDKKPKEPKTAETVVAPASTEPTTATTPTETTEPDNSPNPGKGNKPESPGKSNGSGKSK